MNLMICGSRTIKDDTWIHEQIDTLVSNNNFTDITVIEGGAIGVDTSAKKWAYEKNYNVTEFPALWDNYGRGAGFRRNEDMVKQSDFVLILWDGKSHGAFHDICLSEKYKKPYKICFYKYDNDYVSNALKVISEMKNILSSGNVTYLLSECEKRMN